MWKFSKLVFVLLISFVTAGQCKYTLTGRLISAQEKTPISGAWIMLNTKKKVVSSDDGTFSFEGLCKDSVVLTVTHVSWQHQQKSFFLESSQFIEFELERSNYVLGNAEVLEYVDSPESVHLIELERIDQLPGTQISEKLKELSGADMLRTGAGVAVPIVDGLIADRVKWIQNGTILINQNWGIDHAPEISSALVSGIRKQTGVDGVLFGASHVGGSVEVERQFNKKEGWQHYANNSYHTNGLIFSSAMRTGFKGKKHGFTLGGECLNAGDFQTPDYFLTNSGFRQYAALAQYQYQWSEKHLTELEYTYFQRATGLLFGSIIGNLTDLDNALSREVPFQTSETFSRSFEEPSQDVRHHGTHLSHKFRIAEAKKLEAKLSLQSNDRQEYDRRRGGRGAQPELDLVLISMAAGLHYTEEREQGKWEIGAQLIGLDNTNQPGTGVLPLIPDYQSWKFGMVGAIQSNKGKWIKRFGGRVDFEDRYVIYVPDDIPRRYETDVNQFWSGAFAMDFSREIKHGLELRSETKVFSRAPRVNELYSFGLHQGVSGIEEGNLDLRQEYGVRQGGTIRKELNKKWSVQYAQYLQLFQDFIYLKSSQRTRLTIRGAFPLFEYDQTDAFIHGGDLTLTWDPMEHSEIKFKASYSDAQDLDTGLPLIITPTDEVGINYTCKPKVRTLDNCRVSIGWSHVFGQPERFSKIDLVAPPESYDLFSASFEAGKDIGKMNLTIIAKAENLLNESYRAYLNRHRYFADDLGRNVSVSLILKSK